MDELISKRIHISGLTPAISAKDLTDRLGSFGTVKSLDGFGTLDAVGLPRKYAYATLETTKGKLARCMNFLSGATWKGANLRLGEAKPDYRERIAKEHADLKRAAEEAQDGPPKKRRRLPRGVQGVHARDMSLVTPENVSTRGGWRVTPTGRLIRPMRMRPTHPLPETSEMEKKGKEKGRGGKSKKRVREPPSRARRKTIDPTRWGSQHLKGIFLENAAAFVPPSPLPPSIPVHHDDGDDVRSQSEHSESEEGSTDETDSINGDSPGSPPPAGVAPPANAIAPVVARKSSISTYSIARELMEEKNQSMGLLQSLFGDKEDWGGAESVGSDIENDDERVEVSPVDDATPEVDIAQDADAAMNVDEPDEPSPPPRNNPPVPAQAKLKDLFAPREEDAGFSLLGHLDLDLELEDDVPFDIPAPAPASTTSQSLDSVEPSRPHTLHMASLDATRPFFFPTDHGGAKGRTLDPTQWRTWFYRTDTPEAIRARWEETKGELTAGWKRRHREAIKSRKRRGGAGEAD